jgi:carbon monoxide dehydrogenase subunit G
MELSGTYTFDAQQQAVWDILMSPDAIATAIPGVKEMQPLDGEVNAFHASAKVNVGAVSGTYSGTIRQTDITPPHQFRLTVKGEGQQSVINGTALVNLSFDADNKQTIVTWSAEAHISGKLTSIGQRLITSTAGLLSRQFFGGLAKQIKT